AGSGHAGTPSTPRPDAKRGEASGGSLRPLPQARRHRERTFRDVLLRLRNDPDSVVKVYKSVLGVLAGHYVEPDKTHPGKLFEQGVKELRFALEDEAFVREHLGRARAGDLDKLRS